MRTLPWRGRERVQEQVHKAERALCQVSYALCKPGARQQGAPACRLAERCSAGVKGPVGY